MLADANIKLDTVLSDLLGVSGRALLRGLIQGRTDRGWLAGYARDSLRGKRDAWRSRLVQGSRSQS